MILRKLRLLPALLCVSLLSGCYTIPYTYQPDRVRTKPLSGAVEAVVKDVRPFVLNGDKEPSYIGHYRGGFGNTLKVKTKGNIALADQFQKDLEKELTMLGAVGEGPARILRVEILDYNFDAYINGRFWYEFKVTVLAPDGNALAEDIVKDEHRILGSFWIGPMKAFQRKMPQLHWSIVRSLAQDNPVIMDALKA